MGSLTVYVLLIMLLAVKASEDFDIMQREIDLIDDEILDTLKQGLLVPSSTVRQKGPRIKPYSINPSIPFPLARPTMGNIIAICHYSNLRPRYTKDMLPRDGFGYLHRQASAVNQLESWFTVCCSNGTQDEKITLCCAHQAWEKSLNNFCQEEFTIKTRHYHCCKKDGPAIWDCFDEEAPDSLYQPSEEEVVTVLPSTIQGFEFNPSSCKKTSVSETNPRQEILTEPSISSGIEQKMMIPQIPIFVEGKGHHVPSPSIPFPLAPPTTNNIRDICQYSNQRPWYPKEALPKSGLGHMYRQASAVNQLESWYSVCCVNSNQDDKLCCAQQAWVKSLIAFCEKELKFRSAHHCCRENWSAKWDCFENEASDTSYQPSGHEVLNMLPSTIQGFDFNPNLCPTKSISEVASRAMTEHTERIKAAGIDFPPGRPNLINIVPICAFHKYRPRYFPNCLIHPEFHQHTHELKTIDGLEKRFGQCCKENKDVHACAEKKWKNMVDRFCKEQKKVQINQFECCKKQKGEGRYDCFSTAAPNQNYSLMNYSELSDVPPSINMLCDTYTAVQKMKRLPFTVDEMAEKCCILVAHKRSACIELKLDTLLDDACKPDNPSLAQVKPNCCKKAAQGRSKCFTKLLLHSIAKAKRESNRKKCPIIL